MNTRIERIIRTTDGQEPDGALTPAELAQADAHSALGALMKQAYAFKPADAPLAFMGERILARARAAEPEGFTARLQALWHMLVGHPVLAFGGTMAVLALVVTISVQQPEKQTPVTTSTATEPAHMRSFIIYDMPDGNGFFQCVEYESVSRKSNGNESS